MIGISHDDLLAITYIFPKINWKARGEYRYIFDTVAPNNTLVYEHVDDDSWFFLNNCEDNHGYMLIFPILDIDCGMPGEASWTATDDGTVRLSWEPGSSASQWEVSYGPSGALPGDDSVVTTATPLAILHDITPGTHYVAYIRSLCTVRDTTWSDWTDSVSIFIPDPTGILEAEDSKTGVELTPNPATGEVRIASGIEMMQIEVYDEKGGLLHTLPATGLKADLDVSSWPRGTYLLRILTPAGPTTKKLLVQ